MCEPSNTGEVNKGASMACALRKLAVLAATTFLFVALACAQSPTFHSDYQRTGRSQDAGPIGPHLLWTFQADGSIAASPVVSPDGTIYLASTDGHLYALTLDGSRKWEFAAGESLFATPSLDSGGRLYFGDLDGWFYCLSSDGVLQWKYQLPGGTDRRILGSPAITPDGSSYVTAWSNELYSFGPEGNLRWRAPLNGLPSSAPALDGEGNVYLACLDLENPSALAIQRFSASSPTPDWTFQEALGSSSNRIISAPAIDTGRNRLYIGVCAGSGGRLIALNLATRQVVFRKSFSKGVLSSPAIRQDGTILVGCLDGRLYALDPQQGTERWVFQTDAPYIFGSPSIDRIGNCFIGDSDGTVYAISSSGQRLWTVQANSNIESAPVIHAGRLYVTLFDSRLLTLGDEETRTRMHDRTRRRRQPR
ncbi:MAG: hypothetical protein EHM61_04465 [Acidobacteria bacterium]|nr:MAG: hypothetical protein EHM61_04465 [Acidobacteriota bacterium]